jgi:Fe/S biogenesis protein NfuA
MVKMHGGEVSLVEITDEDVAIISFGGGCQGCSAVDATLKHVVEDTIMKAVPEVKGVKDITDHTDTSNAYYS